MKDGSRALLIIMTALTVVFASITATTGCSGGKNGPADGAVSDGGEDGGGGTDGGQCLSACKWLSDCPKADCQNGCCVKAERCRCEDGSDKCPCALGASGNQDCRPLQICLEQRWIKICTTDLDCPDDGYCFNGVCTEYKFKMDYPEPNKGGAKGVLKAGFGEALVDTPIGVSMAGYGGRSGPRTPYAFNLGGSNGMHDRPTVKAVVLDNGAERIVFVRNSLSWSTDFFNTEMARKLGDSLKENYLNKMISSNFHSHSFPARYWTAAYGTGMGAAGSDDFLWEAFDRLTTSHAKAVEDAVKSLAPAKFSYAFDHNFDPTDKIIQARSTDTFGDNKDRDLLVMRIDYADGPNKNKTMAVIARYGSHGTHMSDTMMSGDAPAAAEYISEDNFIRDLGYRVPVVYLNGNNGNARPQGNTGPDGKTDILRGDDYLAVQAVGHWFYPMLKALYDNASAFNTSPDMKIVSRFIPLDRKSLGYKDEEFYDMKAGERVTYWNGAMLCCNPYKTGGYVDGAMNCVLDVNLIGNGTPFPEINRVRTTSLRIGNLLIIALPGEVTNPYGQKMVTEVRKATGLTDVFTIGLSQDHQFYLLTTEDWWKGSYEASMDIWGWKFGDYVGDFALENTSQLKDVATAADQTGKLKPSYYESYVDQPYVTPSQASTAPGFFAQPPATVVKYDIVAAKFHGGDPGLGPPRIFLERKEGANWVSHEIAPGVPYDDARYHMEIFYPGYDNKDYYKSKHDWEMRWQELHLFPAGEYRFRVEGLNWDGSKGAAYKIYSDPFTVKNIENVQVYSPSRAGSDITFRLRYPTTPAKSMRLNSAYVPETLGAPLNETKTVKVEASCDAQTYTGNAVQIGFTDAKESIKDAANKTWNVAYSTVTFPDFATKTCEYNVKVTDTFGNSGIFKATIP